MLKNKKILISGIISNRSISYGIAKRCVDLGAEIALTYQEERFANRIAGFVEDLGAKFPIKLDASNDKDIKGLPLSLHKNGWAALDGYVHGIAFSPREAISGKLTDGFTRSNFTTAHEVSSYSFGAILKELSQIFSQDSSVMTISYIGSQRIVPNYNMMGLAKASLEASVRYLAEDFGPTKGIRVNAISAGPIKTLAASGIKGFSNILNTVEKQSPLRRNVTKEEIGDLAVFLLSGMSRSITGQIIVADNGFSNAVAL